MPKVILDACVLSNFAYSRSLGILHRLYGGQLGLTNFVVAEVIRGIQRGHGFLLGVKTALKEGWIEEVAPRTSAEKDIFEKLSESLGLGEASAIAVALGRGLVFASDDFAARREAARLGVRLTGTLGILKRACVRGIVKRADADKRLRVMIDGGFFSPVKSISEIP